MLKFLPARDQAKDDRPVIVDLDKLTADPQIFRWGGRVHQIKPIDTRTFFILMEKISGLDGIAKDGVSKEEFVDAYAGVFSAVCDTIDRKDVERMTTPQRGALLQFILDCVRGRAQADGVGEKKKTLTEASSTR